MNLTELNLISLDTELKQGQRCIRIGNSIIPVGVGGIFAPGSNSFDFSAATAAASDVLSSKKFYNNQGELTTGSIQTVTASLDGNTVHIPKGYIAVSDSISVAVGADVILGVVDQNGFFQPLRFEGTQASNSGSAIQVQNYKSWKSTLSAPQPSGGTMEFYKCASVDASNSTWTGYKAILSSGIYRYELSVTSNLTYGSGFTPEIGGIYSNGALLQADLFDIPTNGQVFYAPLSDSASTAETGQNLVTVGNVTYQNVNGIPCAYSDTTSGIKTDVPCADMDPGIPKTMSVWVKITQLPTNEYNQGVFCNLQGTGGVTFTYYTVDADTVDLVFDRWDSNVSDNYNHLQFGNVSLNTWYHFVSVDTGTELRAYIDGQLVQSNSASTNYQKCQYSSNLWFLSAFEEYSLVGYMASARIYNRALSADEVLALSKEFTPTQA